MKKLSKKEAEEEIKKFFLDMKNKSPDDVKKIKKLAMRFGLKLKEQRKKFCKKCLSPYSGKEKIGINKGIKSVKCRNCNSPNRWKLN